ncbi:MAG: DUF4091 domain-containing protein [Lentisphaerae bacterium]|nr:DUF4091 domain-containing protein [Lentisphaerota bacterium]
MFINSKWTSSLEKIFLHKTPSATDYQRNTALQGEVFSLQLVYQTDFLLNPLSIKIISPLKEYISIRQVYSMPATFFGEKQDEFILDNTPGLYPDLLGDCSVYRSGNNLNHSLWLTIRLPRDIQPGTYPIQLEMGHTNLYSPERCFEHTTPVFELEVLPVQLPQAKIKITEWLHCDCLADYYKLEPWSDEFFAVLKNYFLNMSSHGINMVYVPLFTPPLDTLIGTERPTMQSVDVAEDEHGNWSFNFSKLERFLNLADECGLLYWEFSHLFTQWGAEFTPKIIVRMPDGKMVRRFGWDVRSNSDLYQKFLAALLPELNRMLQKHNWNSRSYFHISDEPYENNLEAYRQASELFHRNLPGVKFIDALSRTEFFTNGLVDIPVPANNHIEAFRTLELPERWTYYCVSQWEKVPNQFAHFPSARLRIIGVLAYVYDLDGFLHWGYNFWFGQLSSFRVDPYSDICSGRGFPPGDAFKVYPGKNGIPEDSIRHELFYDALQDLAALQLLEAQTSRDETLEFIKQAWNDRSMTMEDYPREAGWLLEFRQKLNQRLAADK